MVLSRYVIAAVAAHVVTAKISVQVHRNLELANTTNVVVKFQCGDALKAHRRRLKATASRQEVISSVVDALKEHSNSIQAPVRDLLTSKTESTTSTPSVQSTWIDCSMYVDNISADMVKKIAAYPEVKSIHEPVVVNLGDFKPVKPNTEAATVQWGVEKINAPAAWKKGIRGEGVVVGSIDTGVRYTHESLKDNWRKEYGWFDPYNNTALPNDPWGHGTHTMGTMVGTTKGYGVAPDAKWMSCMGCNYLCYQQQVMQCAQFLLCPHDTEGKNPDCSKAPHVINNSWGQYWGLQTWFDDAINAWREAGIIPVFSNCNEGHRGCGFVGYPASSPKVIGVGGTNVYERLYSSTSLGPTLDNRLKPDIAAPGEDVVSAGNWDDISAATFSGTSMAAPHISGAIALYLSKNKGASFDQVYTALTNTVDTKTLVSYNKSCGGIPDTQFPNNIFGYGRVNALNAVTTPPSTPRPTPPMPPRKCSQTEEDWDFVGNDLESVLSPSFDDCCDICEKHTKCNAYTWNWDNGGTCWLKQVTDIQRNYVPGVKSAQLLDKPTPSKCGALEENTDYEDNDLSFTRQTDATKCCRDCESTPGCRVFVWTGYNGGTCWLKKAKGRKIIVQGAKAGSLPTQNTCGTVEENTDFVGQDIASVPGAKGDCCGACEANKACNAYSWFNNVCYLKSTRSNTIQKSGVASARVNKCSVIEKDIDYVANDIASVVGSVDDCCALCRQNPECGAFSWAYGVCYLKSSKGQVISKAGVHSAVVIS